MSERTTPVVSTVISTRDRGADVSRAVETVLTNDYPNFELIVVDQSKGEATERALGRFLEEPRLHYFRAETKGLARGLNLGVSHANGAIFAFTDDDCEVPSDWLEKLVHAFSEDDRIGVVFGNVVAGDHDPNLGFIPAYVRSEPFLATTIRDKHKAEGIGACMAVRRSVWCALGGFDEAFGAGGGFRSAADLDLSIRALLAGHAVYETPEARVVHRGFRTWDSAPALLRDYMFGTGGCTAKQLKRGNWRILGLLSRLAWRWAFRRPVVDLGKSPPRGLRLWAFTQGFVAGMRRPVDRRGHYIST